MPRFCVIENGVVINTIEAENQYAQSIGAVRSDVAGIGWIYDGTDFMRPADPPSPKIAPGSVTMRQARLALLSAGLLDDIDAAIAAIPDATQRRAAQIEWEYAANVERSAGWVANLAGALGLTDAQLDALFVQAAAL